MEIATFAGGCFWCMVSPYDDQPGVIKVESGYTGGELDNPSYEQVKAGTTGHREAVQITFDPKIISFSELLNLFWHQIDPTDSGGQFADRGQSYQAAIYYHSEEQKLAAIKSKQALAESGRFEHPIVTDILPAVKFWAAEDYHQDFHKKNPVHYKSYRKSSGREAFTEETWHQPIDDQELKTRLSDQQYRVTRENGTEPPFTNEYWDNTAEGIYVDIITGQPLFSSKDKYDAGCGWPSFTRTLHKMAVKEQSDVSHGMQRTEVRSRGADSHLGHVFSDGPKSKGGLRYCINSAALRFIAKEDLEQQGYGRYLSLFDGPGTEENGAD